MRAAADSHTVTHQKASSQRVRRLWHCLPRMFLLHRALTGHVLARYSISNQLDLKQ